MKNKDGEHILRARAGTSAGSGDADLWAQALWKPPWESPQVPPPGMSPKDSLWEGGVRRDKLVRKDRLTSEYTAGGKAIELQLNSPFVRSIRFRYSNFVWILILTISNRIVIQCFLQWCSCELKLLTTVVCYLANWSIIRSSEVCSLISKHHKLRLTSPV